MSKTLILGSTGLLGQSLVKHWTKKKENVIGVARKNSDFNLDITQDHALYDMLTLIKPTHIINAAAIVNLNYCEKHPTHAYLTNAHVNKVLVQYCKTHSCKLIFISTDHYYTGDTYTLHKENDPVNLSNEYALSKYLGESIALTDKNSLIIRTNIVGFRNWENQPSFVEWIVNTLEKKEPISLFTDYITSSLDVTTFSDVLYKLIKRNASGIFNVASSEASSKEAFVLAFSKAIQLSLPTYTPVEMKTTPHVIKRNESLGLDVSKTAHYLGLTLPNLSEVVTQLANEYKGVSS